MTPGPRPPSPIILLLTIIPVMLINIRRFQAQEAIR